MTKKQRRKLFKAIESKMKSAPPKVETVAPTDNTIIEAIMEVSKAVEDNKSAFTRAGDLQIFDSEGRHLKDYKAIVNEEKHERVFAIVSKGYKIVQHEEVVQAVEESIKGLELESENRVKHLDDGARIRFITKFPKIKVEIDQKPYYMQMFWDNSYNLTTGVRLILGVFSPGGYTLYLDNKLANFYHRHTKGLDLNKLSRAIKSGMATFMDGVKEEFEKMIATPLTMDKALNFLDTCIEEKVIATCYLETLRNELRKMPADELDSQWVLYNLINQVLDERVKSLDTKERHISILNKRMKSLK
jgi:hypothetical protein